MCIGSGCGTGCWYWESFTVILTDRCGNELSKEAAYLAYGVEQQGADYLKNIKDKSARITYIDQDGTVLFDNEADVSEMEEPQGQRLSFRRLRSMVQENLQDIRIHFLRKPFIMHCV